MQIAFIPCRHVSTGCFNNLLTDLKLQFEECINELEIDIDVTKNTENFINNEKITFENFLNAV